MNYPFNLHLLTLIRINKPFNELVKLILNHILYADTIRRNKMHLISNSLISPRSQLLQLKKEKLEYTPGEHEYGLLPAPIHVGESVSYS